MNEEKRYRVEVEDGGCGTCGSGRLYRVIDPEGSGASTAYTDLENAEHEADICNHAFELGYNKILTSWSELKAERDRLLAERDALSKHYADGMIAHRWFAQVFGEHFNGRDFAVKCPMADAELAQFRQERATATETCPQCHHEPHEGQCKRHVTRVVGKKPEHFQ